MEERLKAMLSTHEARKDELIPILQLVQREYGYLPQDIMLEVARFTRVPEGRVYGVASFYAQFRFTPVGRNMVMVCRGTACHVSGAPRILQGMENRLGIKVNETTADLEYTLESVACIGACSLAPCTMVNGKVEAKLTLKKVAALFPKGSEK